VASDTVLTFTDAFWPSHLSLLFYRKGGGASQQAIGKLASKALVYKCLGSSVRIDIGERIRYKPIARVGVTPLVIKQKSADGIVPNARRNGRDTLPAVGASRRRPEPRKQ
jgi:hypothetical protein